MKKKLLTIIGTLILFAILFTPSVFALGFGAHAEYWIPTFKGDLRVDKDGTVGTEIDIKNDLGVSNENFPGVEAFFSMGNHEIRLSYSFVSLSGATNIGKTIVFDGDTYNVNAYVESDLKTSMFDLEYQYKFLNLENILAGFSLGLIGKVKYFDGEVRMRSTTPGSVYDNQEDFHVPIPMIGLGVNVGILADILEARAKITGMGYSGSFFYDAMVDISLTPVPFLNIHGGYRAMSLKIDDVSDIYAKMDFYGPYAGLAISF
jgi:outer membrane protein